ncbi:DUF3168 domain-containing protein [Bacteroides sedimenti]|uniref:DUF3168 domain-containing protein n=1 Tax=Bacteroides sedimenti TaxID=2136147 RepID=A0ABM8I7M3_9BACE
MALKSTKFRISSAARDILMADTTVRALIGSRIFPCVAPEDTDEDFILYYRDKYAVEQTKQGIYMQTATVMFAVVSNGYERSQEIAEAIFIALTESNTATRFELIDSTEDYSDKKYVQLLLFEIQ